jgi:hypothetical protein
MNKYEIAKEIEQEDTLNAIECLGYDTSRLSNDELAIINDELQDALANDDIYNAIYNEALQDILAAHNIEQL